MKRSSQLTAFRFWLSGVIQEGWFSGTPGWIVMSRDEIDRVRRLVSGYEIGRDRGGHGHGRGGSGSRLDKREQVSRFWNGVAAAAGPAKTAMQGSAGRRRGYTELRMRRVAVWGPSPHL
jgi:hypothetical protein